MFNVHCTYVNYGHILFIQQSLGGYPKDRQQVRVHYDVCCKELVLHDRYRFVEISKCNFAPSNGHSKEASVHAEKLNSKGAKLAYKIGQRSNHQPRDIWS